jgi:hypothetical protein
MARAWRMRGYNVLHPMGRDAFGLPAEQHAIETGQHPAGTTANNIATFKRQLKMLGFSYDWSREIDTTDPGYVRWTQWIFLQLFRRGLAYQATVPVNWCPALGTVLANEEVVDGKSERGGHPVYRTPLRQWMLKITAYADRLAEDLALVDWPEGTLTAQRRWIGRSEGAEIVFGVDGHSDARIAVFTTRPRYPHGRDLRRARARARADAHAADAGAARGLDPVYELFDGDDELARYRPNPPAHRLRGREKSMSSFGARGWELRPERTGWTCAELNPGFDSHQRDSNPCFQSATRFRNGREQLDEVDSTPQPWGLKFARDLSPSASSGTRGKRSCDQAGS